MKKIIEVICQYCGEPAEYIDSKYYYSNGVSYGMIYWCKKDDAMVGTHKNSGKPLGSLANKELRELRKECHVMFDKLWKDGEMTRKEAYRRLEERLGIKHIAWTTNEEAKRIIEFL